MDHNATSFWDFVHSLDPRYQAGAGVDHATGGPRGPPGPPPPPFPHHVPGPHFGPEFPFGPGAFGHPRGDPRGGPFGGGPFGGRGGHRGPWGRRGPGPFGPGMDFNWDDWGRRGSWRHGAHGRGCRRNHCDSSDEEENNNNNAAPAADRDVNMGEVEGEAFNEKAGDDRDPEKDDSPATMRENNDDEEHPDPPEEIPGVPPHHRHRHAGRRGRGGFGRGRGRHHTHHHGPGSPPPPPPPYTPGGGFDFRGFAAGFGPFMQNIAEQVRTHAQAAAANARDQAGRSRGMPGAFPFGGPDNHNANNNENNDGEDVLFNYDDLDNLNIGNDNGAAANDTFTPPVDVFNTPTNWTIHVALPGAKKEDVGVNWDADRGLLAVSGVVHRPGDETFIAGMISGERRVGLFERHIRLPPPVSAQQQQQQQQGEDGEKEKGREEVDVEGITARMEDGVLIVVVPKVEKEGWTEVRKVDIE